VINIHCRYHRLYQCRLACHAIWLGQL
jgi:hypothetical protein